MGASIRQVATASEQVERLAEETASSMVEMDRALNQVGGHVAEAATLTANASESAEQGAKAVAETIADIERIHASTEEAKSGLETLVSRISAVSSILDVIGEINDETKLLSLNAAIIAAQAGERGKAFLVVANQVKTLSRRTTASTQEITALLADIQRDSDVAVDAMDSGIEVIEQGVSRSRVAGRALESILESSKEASARVSQITRATAEQTRTSGAVAEAAQTTSDKVREISAAIAVQSKASEEVLESSEAALNLCRQVHRSTDEQRETGGYIAESISTITEMVRKIQQSAKAHDEASEAVSQAVNSLLENARASASQVPELREMLDDMRGGAQRVVAELERFRSTTGNLD